jgi:hypothetical protein
VELALAALSSALPFALGKGKGADLSCVRIGDRRLLSSFDMRLRRIRKIIQNSLRCDHSSIENGKEITHASLRNLMAFLMSSARSDITPSFRLDERKKVLSSDMCSDPTLHTKKANKEAER